MNTDQIQFTPEEYARYSRHMILPGFGPEAQKKLKASRVLVVGAGGLGSPVLLYLAAAGIGTIGIVDFDVVDDSNLQRQVLYSVGAISQPKVEAARDRLKQLNPHIQLVLHRERLTSENALNIIKDYDVVADGTDNFPTRYLVNDACVLLGKPNVYASIFQFEGQVSVFNQQSKDGTPGPNYRDLYPEPPKPGQVPDCAEGGVLGVLPGIIGSLQALEVIKVVTGIGESLSGRFFIFDALSFESTTIKIKRNPHLSEIKELIDYEAFCGMKNARDDIKEITPQQLQQMLSGDESFQLIDVREPHEYETVNIGGELIPLASILSNKEKIDSNNKVILHCKSGSRSIKAIQELQSKFNYNNLYNLKGGLIAYLNEIKPELKTKRV